VAIVLIIIFIMIAIWLAVSASLFITTTGPSGDDSEGLRVECQYEMDLDQSWYVGDTFHSVYNVSLYYFYDPGAGQERPSDIVAKAVSGPVDSLSKNGYWSINQDSGVVQEWLTWALVSEGKTGKAVIEFNDRLSGEKLAMLEVNVTAPPESMRYIPAPEISAIKDTIYDRLTVTMDRALEFKNVYIVLTPDGSETEYASALGPDGYPQLSADPVGTDDGRLTFWDVDSDGRLSSGDIFKFSGHGAYSIVWLNDGVPQTVCTGSF